MPIIEIHLGHVYTLEVGWDALLATCSGMQVYRARIRATGQEVAVKVQRPAALGTISKVIGT